jgi:hypothetical protein
MIELWHTATVEKVEELSPSRRRSEYLAIPEPTRGAKSFYSERVKGEDRQLSRAEQIARWRMQQLFEQHGDDGILEHIAADKGAGARGAAAELASGVRNRLLFAHAANVARPVSADDLYKQFGSATRRRELEAAACRHAQIGENWKVIIWVPGPDMRLKLAELLVDDGRGIAKFKDQFQSGSDIYEAHRELWTISVFVHPEVTREQPRAVLAQLSANMGVLWDKDGRFLGEDPADAPLHLAAVEVVKSDKQRRQIETLVDQAREEVAARGRSGSESHFDLVQLMKDLRRVGASRVGAP